jgi:hypothetical protein
MRIEQIEMIEIELNSDEKLSFNVVDEVLRGLQFRFAKNTKLTGKEEGTVIEIQELARVRGILNCLLKNLIFERETIDN